MKTLLNTNLNVNIITMSHRNDSLSLCTVPGFYGCYAWDLFDVNKIS